MGPEKNVPQNDVKNILVLEFLKSDDFLGVMGEGSMKKLTDRQPNKQPTNHPNLQTLW